MAPVGYDGPVGMAKALIRIRKTGVRVEIAETVAGISLGLMFRKRLARTEGMLLRLPRSGNHSIHMWFVRFPLDIVFIREDGTIARIRRAVPWQMPFRAGSRVCFILEVNGGFCRRNGIRAGDRCRNLPR